MTSSGVRFVWEESRRLLVRQEADLDTLRGRSVTLMTAGSVVAGLFGGRLHGGHLTWYAKAGTGAALVAFVLSIAVGLFIVWPRHFKFSHSLDDLISDLRIDLDHPDAAEPHLAFNLARDFNDYRKENAPKVKCLYDRFSMLCVLLAVQVVAWGVTLL